MFINQLYKTGILNWTPTNDRIGADMVVFTIFLSQVFAIKKDPI